MNEKYVSPTDRQYSAGGAGGAIGRAGGAFGRADGGAGGGYNDVTPDLPMARSEMIRLEEALEQLSDAISSLEDRMHFYLNPSNGVCAGNAEKSINPPQSLLADKLHDLRRSAENAVQRIHQIKSRVDA